MPEVIPHRFDDTLHESWTIGLDPEIIAHRSELIHTE
jgi:hypothetical protein